MTEIKIYAPKDNADFTKQEYWEARFDKEEQYEWLVSYEHIADMLKSQLVTGDTDESKLESYEQPILLIGCGNSNLGHDLWNDGFTNVESMDYIESVINRMKEKYFNLYAENPEKLAKFYKECKFTCADILDMSNYSDSSFSTVIDKATMDVLLADNKDPWNPAQHVIEKSNTALRNVQRVLKPRGMFLSISFDQPHFRKMLLLNDTVKDGWLSYKVHNINRGLGYFMYVLINQK